MQGADRPNYVQLGNRRTLLTKPYELIDGMRRQVSSVAVALGAFVASISIVIIGIVAITTLSKSVSPSEQNKDRIRTTNTLAIAGIATSSVACVAINASHYMIPKTKKAERYAAYGSSVSLYLIATALVVIAMQRSETLKKESPKQPASQPAPEAARAQ